MYICPAKPNPLNIRWQSRVKNKNLEISNNIKCIIRKHCLTGWVWLLLMLFASEGIKAQETDEFGTSNETSASGNVGGRSSGAAGPFKDSLVHRTGLEDSASIIYRFMDEERFYFQDSSVHDFTKRWPVPWSHIFLGNTGSASRSLLFSPLMQGGWDHGFHAFELYHNDARQSRFYNVTRPFSELSYILGSKAEQNIGIFHTQNIRYNWNFSFDYRMTNAPGIFKNQKNSHNRYLLNSWYKSKNNRYHLFFATTLSKTGASENGGIQNVKLISDIPTYSDRIGIPTNLGGEQFESRSLLSNIINTGNIYRKREFILSNSYDFGRKDSVKTDTAYQPIFIAKWRLQYNFHYQDYDFRFEDKKVDPEGYSRLYGLINLQDQFLIRDKWELKHHEFSVLHFPEQMNLNHRLKTAIIYQQIDGDFGDSIVMMNNIALSGDYRNRTKNGNWDFQLKGKFFAGGYHSGDYQAEINLTRFLGKNKNLLTLSFANVNRTPSFIHNNLSNFKLFNRGLSNFNKENHSVISGKYQIPRLKMDLSLRYYIMSNYVYFSDIKKSSQDATVFNVAMLGASRKFRLNKSWSWYIDLIFQQATANAPVNLPLITARNRLAYEGVYFRNLTLSAGIESRYVSSFYADGYSPLLGQFYLQQDTLISNRPDITAYLHFRIRSSYVFIRAENLNAVQFSPFGFFQNNFAAPSYPMPGLFLRFGIYWGFVN
jgi:hypothetical protein